MTVSENVNQSVNPIHSPFPEQPYWNCMEDATGRKGVAESYHKEMEAYKSNDCGKGCGYGSLARAQLMGGLFLNGSLDMTKMFFGILGGTCRFTCATVATICCPFVSLCKCCKNVQKDAKKVGDCWKGTFDCFGYCCINTTSCMERTICFPMNLMLLEPFNLLGQISCWRQLELCQAKSALTINFSEDKWSKTLCSDTCVEICESACDEDSGTCSDDGCCNADCTGEVCEAICECLCAVLTAGCDDD